MLTIRPTHFKIFIKYYLESKTSLLLDILAALTDSNHIAIWKLSPDKKIDSEDAWSLQPAVHLDLPCSMIEVLYDKRCFLIEFRYDIYLNFNLA